MIAFVALGGTPAYLKEALRQTRQSNPDLPVVLLHDQRLSAWRSFASALGVQTYHVGVLDDDSRLRAFRSRPDARGAFWMRTSERFFVLRAFMEREGVARLTHLENDVLLYAPLTEIGRDAPFGSPRLAAVFESPDRAIPGVVDVGSRAALDVFTDLVLAEDPTAPQNDMVRFATFRRSFPDLVQDLPTLPPVVEEAEVTVSLLCLTVPVALPRGGWLFDGARFGQYLGGIDPSHHRNVVLRWIGWRRGRMARPNGFVNESCADDPSRYRYRVVRPRGLAVPAVVRGERAFPLATLHVHSKKLHRFRSDALEALCPRR
jgi:hypothetical protein